MSQLVNDVDVLSMKEMENLRVICRTTHKGAEKGRYYYMTDFEPYDAMYEDVPSCPECEKVDSASWKLRDLEDKDIQRRWQLRGGGDIHTPEGLRVLTPEYKAFLNDIGAERYNGCGRTTSNFSGKADRSRYIGSPNQPDPHVVDKKITVKKADNERYWWEGTNDPLAWTPGAEHPSDEAINALLAQIEQEKEKE